MAKHVLTAMHFFVFDEKQNEFLPYMPLDEAKDQYVMLDELMKELKEIRGLEVAA